MTTFPPVAGHLRPAVDRRSSIRPRSFGSTTVAVFFAVVVGWTVVLTLLMLGDHRAPGTVDGPRPMPTVQPAPPPPGR